MKMFKSNNFKLIIFFCLIFSNTNSYSYYDEENKDELCYLYSLQDKIDIGDEAKFILFLPKLSKNYNTWEFFFHDSEVPIEKGNLSEANTQKIINVKIANEGKYSIFLVLKNKKGEASKILSTMLETKPGKMAKFFEKNLGILTGAALGAFISVIVFVIQSIIQRMFLRKAEKLKLSARINAYIDEIIEALKKSDDFPKLPNSLIDPDNINWSIYIKKESFKSLIAELKKIKTDFEKRILANEEAVIELKKLINKI